MIKDLTKGNPLKCILQFAVPMFFGNLFQQMYNMADSIIVGKYVGVKALAAVGGTGALNFLILGFIFGVSSGFMIPMSQSFGAKDFDKLRKFMTNSIILSFIIGLIITLITVVFTKDILRIMKTPEDIFEGSYEYIVTIFAGTLAIMFYNLFAGIMRALGDSKTPLYFLIFSSLLNIGLDLLFVLVFKMGVFGAALATDIAQVASCVLCYLFIKKNYKILKTEKGDWALNTHAVGRLLVIGVPMGLQYSITAIGSTVLQTAINSLGSVYVAAITAGGKVSMIFTQAYETIGATMATFCGQNLGAKKISRIHQGIRQSIAVITVYTIIAFIGIRFLGNYLALLFLDSSETVIFEYLGKFLFANSLFYFALGLLLILRNAIQGLGHSMFAMFAGLMEMLARSIAAFFMLDFFGVNAIYYSNAAAWVAANVFLIPAFLYTIKKIEGLITEVRKDGE